MSLACRLVVQAAGPGGVPAFQLGGLPERRVERSAILRHDECGKNECQGQGNGFAAVRETSTERELTLACRDAQSMERGLDRVGEGLVRNALELRGHVEKGLHDRRIEMRATAFLNQPDRILV